MPVFKSEKIKQAEAVTTHRIDLQAPEKGHGKTRMSYLGQPIGASDSPIFAAARWLLANGLASPDDTVAAYRAKPCNRETLCMSGKAGVLAKWTVEENASRLRLVKYRPRRDGVASRTSNPNLRILGHDRARHCNRRIIPWR
jgi:hypothetical protein